MRMVSQAKLKIKGGDPNGQQKSITYSLEMPVPYRIHSKIQKKVLYGRLREDVREIIATLCKYKNVEIIAGAVCIDHVHLIIAIPPKRSVSDFMGYLKGKSTLMLYDRHLELQSKSDATVQKYIKEQAEESRKEDPSSTALQRASKSACDTALRDEQQQ